MFILNQNKGTAYDSTVPQIAGHLEMGKRHGLVSVVYAGHWLLTVRVDDRAPAAVIVRS